MKNLVYDLLEKRGITNVEYPDLLEQGIDEYVEIYRDVVQVNSNKIKEDLLDTFSHVSNDQLVAYFVNYDKIVELRGIETTLTHMYFMYKKSIEPLISDKVKELRKEYIDIYDRCIGDITPFIFTIQRVDEIIEKMNNL